MGFYVKEIDGGRYLMENGSFGDISNAKVFDSELDAKIAKGKISGGDKYFEIHERD